MASVHSGQAALFPLSRDLKGPTVVTYALPPSLKENRKSLNLGGIKVLKAGKVRLLFLLFYFVAKANNCT